MVVGQNEAATMKAQDTGDPVLRLRVIVRGVVQGVGFRPMVYRLATESGLMGWVANSSQGVQIEVEGKKAMLDHFLLRIQEEKPPHAFIQSLEASFFDPLGFDAFEIWESEDDGTLEAYIPADIATCSECLKEVFDPTDRRYLYPFTNCTHCGPRYSIIYALPYDRCNTTMHVFEMCEKCRQEYEDPGDRRFHAQPNACPTCGPHVQLWDRNGNTIAQHHEAIVQTAHAVLDGAIVAVKGLGGFHLLVDAGSEKGVAELRRRKHREAKPFALLFPSLEMIREECDVSSLEERLLKSSEAPIVLLRKRQRAHSRIASNVAPESPFLGAMLPYTPLHHLLLSILRVPVVATSGNISDEPICIDEHEALQRLNGIADLFLVHNRPILRQVDDSVEKVVMGREQILRRSRGYAPLPISLPEEQPDMLAVGAHQKNTIAFAKGRHACISQHIGDLETQEAHDAFRRTVASLQTLSRAEPRTVVADLHPDYASTQFAAASALPVQYIQHHHAHIASCMADNDLAGPVLGVAWDGTGYGTDGTIWGGEFLVTDGGSYKRVATLRSFRLPGGERAVKQPCRTAVGVLYEILGERVFDMVELSPVAAFGARERSVLNHMLVRNVNAPITTSVGRLFDAVASVAGLVHRVQYEGQAAVMLEHAIDAASVIHPYNFQIEQSLTTPTLYVVDWANMIVGILRDMAHDVPCGVIARRFHDTLAEIIVGVARLVGEERVLLSGGCFQNSYLTERTVTLLRQEGFRPYWHQRVPPNDGGISLGQIFAAGQLMQHRRSAGQKHRQSIHHASLEVE
jgi:hydrogenase maturation protein HypF